MNARGYLESCHALRISYSWDMYDLIKRDSNVSKVSFSIVFLPLEVELKLLASPLPSSNQSFYRSGENGMVGWGCGMIREGVEG